MTIHIVQFPGKHKLDDEERQWQMNDLCLGGKYTKTFWLGSRHSKLYDTKSCISLTGSCITYQSYFYGISREQLWEELHEAKGGLHRLFANQRRESKYGSPTRYRPSLRVNCLIQCACHLEHDGQIALMHENEDHALMIARCIHWVQHIIFEVGDYRKHRPYPRR